MKKWKTITIGLGTGLANGLFGSGGGTVVVLLMEHWLKVKPKKAHATAIAIILPLSIVSLGIYLWKGQILWQVAFWASLGGIAGGYLGAKLLSKLSGPWIHGIFGLLMLISAWRMFV